MNQMIAKTVLLASMLIMGACSMFWGASYNEVAADQDGVKYEYYLAGVNEEGMHKAAQKHCEQFQKDAVLQDREGNDKMINTYICAPRIVYVPVLAPMDTK